MSPLSQLADIHAPDQVSAWPPAIGYWISAAIIISIAIAAAIIYKQRKAKLKAKHRSLVQLNRLNINDDKFLQRVHHLLKTSVNAYLPQVNALSMSASEWTQLLKRLDRKKVSPRLSEPLCRLANWQYDERIELPSNSDIKHASIEWIKQALPPKKGAMDV